MTNAHALVHGYRRHAAAFQTMVERIARAVRALAAEHALAQRAAVQAALPRRHREALRALYVASTDPPQSVQLRMRKHIEGRAVAGCLGVCILLAAGAMALPALAAPRTFVASYGADANFCTLAAPCRSFAAAIARTNPNGEIIVLDSAGYGTVTIGKSVSIVAPPGVYAGITSFGATDGITVDGAGIDVALRGLTLNGQGGGTGIRIVNGARVEIDRCNVANFSTDGLYINAPDVDVRVTNSSLRANGYGGVRVVDGNLTMERSHADDNGHAGVVALHNARASIDRSSLSGNGAYGIKADAFSSGGARVTLTRSLVAHNNGYGLGALAATGGTANLVARGNSITDNGPLCGTCAGIVSEAAAGSLATVVASANVITGSGGYGLKQGNSGTLLSARDNVAIANDVAPTAGTITPVIGE